MKTFLSFISENAAKDKEKDDGFFIDKDGYAVPSEPITVKPPKKDKKTMVRQIRANLLKLKNEINRFNVLFIQYNYYLIKLLSIHLYYLLLN